MIDFNTLGLPQTLLDALKAMDFKTPTPIQAAAIPVALEGRDILGSAQTGTGKTGAFGIPLIAHLINNPDSKAVVMTPTRELATQVLAAMQKMLVGSNIKTALLIGGDSMGKQMDQLRRDPQLVVGTPGRMNDHLKRRSVKLHNADFLVLDETDRMLDMGFGVQIDQVIKHMPADRQTLLFSATLPSNIVKLSDSYMRNPERIAAGTQSKPAENIKQEVINVSAPQKYDTLMVQLAERTGSIIIFVKTKHGADRLARRVSQDGHSSDAIHGDLRQNKREQVIRMFREKKFRVLVATDVAARGLDIPHIEHVINYDLPQVAEDYIHRIGRTARAGASGSAVCFVAPEDRAKWNAIDRLLNGKTAENSDNGGFKSNQRRSSGGGQNRRPAYGQRNERNSGARPERKEYAPRQDRNDSAPRKPWGDKPRGDRNEQGSSERKEYAPRQDRNDGPRKPWSDKPRSDRNDGPRPERKEYAPRQDRNDGPRKPWSDKPRSDRNDGPRPERKEYAPRQEGNNSGPRKPWGDKPRGDRQDGPRPERKEFGQRKPWGDKPRGDRNEQRSDNGPRPERKEYVQRADWKKGKPEGGQGQKQGQDRAPKRHTIKKRGESFSQKPRRDVA